MFPNIPQMFPIVPQNVPENIIWGTLGNRPKFPQKQHWGNFVPVPVPVSVPVPIPVPQTTLEELGN